MQYYIYAALHFIPGKFNIQEYVTIWKFALCTVFHNSVILTHMTRYALFLSAPRRRKNIPVNFSIYTFITSSIPLLNL